MICIIIFNINFNEDTGQRSPGAPLARTTESPGVPTICILFLPETSHRAEDKQSTRQWTYAMRTSSPLEVVVILVGDQPTLKT